METKKTLTAGSTGSVRREDGYLIAEFDDENGRPHELRLFAISEQHYEKIMKDHERC